MNPVPRVETTPRSIRILARYASSDLVLAEYTSKDPKGDARRMRRTIKRHLAKPGSTLFNYQW